ncbi:AT-hook motif nuclear-localized protein 10 isoform X1 [Gastrolobium bilobum]|uniref:AT-hook motif nuclear-localized protein 10 isoform X1 n=1 Tax=Gastrolobium bilobum TaxID=150636 RepID=UPI002AB21E9F|nr:AT-hook motif nuclear-localized protein 10 isoform X1 [Gastrolobium bilobum]
MSSGSDMGNTNRDQFSVGIHQFQQQPPQPQQLQNMQLEFGADGAAVYKPVATASPTYNPSTTVAAASAVATVNINGGEPTAAAVPVSEGQGQLGSTSEPLKRKRGRPRKYGPDGSIGLALTPTLTSPQPAASAAAASPAPVDGGAFSPAPPPPASATPGSSKKGRGRPRGSGNKNRFRASGSAGVSFIPHIINVKAGEDLSSKIMALSLNGPRNVCILTANGAISNVTLRQPASSGGTVTYEGRFEILSLGGSLVLSENDGQNSRYGGLSVSLSGPDGRVLGGGVAGLLVAATPVQVILASFFSEGCKESKSAKQMAKLSAPPKVSAAGQSSSPSRGTRSESSGGPGSPLNQSTGACNNNNPPQGISGMPWK